VGSTCIALQRRPRHGLEGGVPREGHGERNASHRCGRLLDRLGPLRGARPPVGPIWARILSAVENDRTQISESAARPGRSASPGRRRRSSASARVARSIAWHGRLPTATSATTADSKCSIARSMSRTVSAASPSGRCAEPKHATARLAMTGRLAYGASKSYPSAAVSTSPSAYAASHAPSIVADQMLDGGTFPSSPRRNEAGAVRAVASSPVTAARAA
jgi:hypothetical protein